MKNLNKLWAAIMREPAMQFNNTTFSRLISVETSIGYITGNKRKTYIKKVTRKMNADYKAFALKAALKNAQKVLEELEENVLFNPTQHFSGKKTNECLHFTCDTITYIIEDIEKQLKAL